MEFRGLPAGKTAAARQDPGFRLQRQRVDQRCARPTRPASADSRSGSRSRPGARHRRLQQQPALRRRLHHRRRRASWRSTTSVRRRTSSTCTRRTSRVQQQPGQPLVPDHDDRRRLQRPPTEEGADGTGAPGEQLWEPPEHPHRLLVRLRVLADRSPTPGPGEITGTARNWVEWAPYTPAPSPSRSRTRTSRSATPDRPDRLRRPGRRRRQLRHPERSRR